MPYSKNSIAQRDFYNYYKDTCVRKGREYEDYKTFSAIIKDANLIIRNRMLYNSEKLTIPYRLGDLSVIKYENTYNLDNIKKWKVDWKATKELGHIVYFESKYGYKWKWDKKKACVPGRKFYTFKACRKASRLVSDAINNKQLDYYN